MSALTDRSTVTPIEAALEVDIPDQLQWADRADVVVVGWGAAGACAAVEARAQGASVLVLDRFGGGGASTLSGGVVYAGGGTVQQREAGFEDTPATMAAYLRHELQGVVSDDTLERFCRDSANNLAWLESLGARFGSSMPAYKTSYPPDGKFLYHSGNELVPAYAVPGAPAKPAPRGHRAISKGQSGAALFAALREATLKSGARTLTQGAVRRLVWQRGSAGRSGRVIGVELWRIPAGHAATQRHAELDTEVARWRLVKPLKATALRREAAALEREHAQPCFIRADRGVVLSTGGHIYNPDLVKEHAPTMQRGWPIGGAGCDGSGLRLGLSLGGVGERLSNVSAWRFITPPTAWPKGLVVNTRGERFCNEEVYGATLGQAMVEHQGGKAWLVIDSRLRWQAIRECITGGYWVFQSVPALLLMFWGAKKARSVQALAAQMGADPDTLRKTVDAANAAASGQVSDPLGKSASMRQACSQAPFYAMDISIGSPRFPLATLTLGGLRVNEADGHVRHAQGHDIPGLFAAGRCAIGLPSSRYVSGLSLADCVFSGRRAGQAAAREAQA